MKRLGKKKRNKRDVKKIKKWKIKRKNRLSEKVCQKQIERVESEKTKRGRIEKSRVKSVSRLKEKWIKWRDKNERNICKEIRRKTMTKVRKI